MRIAVIGAGAIGGLVGAKLALTGHEVTFMVRGAHLTAIRSKGFRLMDSDGRESDCPQARASDDYQATGPQDLVIIAVKAHHLPSVAPDIHHLLGQQTPVITMQNGIPYW